MIVLDTIFFIHFSQIVLVDFSQNCPNRGGALVRLPAYRQNCAKVYVGWGESNGLQSSDEDSDKQPQAVPSLYAFLEF